MFTTIFPVAILLFMLATACGSDNASPPDAATMPPDAATMPPAAENWDRDILSIDLQFDLATRNATATVTFAGDDGTAASLRVGDLEILDVRSELTKLHYTITEDRLDLGLPSTELPIAVTIDYRFAIHTEFDGYMAAGFTLTWPYFCGNLFPCNPDPSEGQRFTMNVTGVPDGESAIYPASIPADAPAYMAAFTVGDYSYLELPPTTAGTALGAYYLPGGEQDARDGTGNLRGYVEFLEQTYGDYVFGDKIAAVATNWGAGALGGMEHHPYFHIASGAMEMREVQAHEAAHGWFGNGVRIACWEDFVLSEGVTQYLTVRAVEQADGLMAAEALWTTLHNRLTSAVASGDTQAYPDGCNEIDIYNHPLWSRIPYEKGAFFFRAVEQTVGREALDASLSAFYTANVGQARHMSELIAAIEADTDTSLETLVAGWLTGLGIPE